MTPSKIPATLLEYISRHSFQTLEPAWLNIQKNSGDVVATGGSWAHYFQQQPEAGHQADEYCVELMGMLPIVENFELPQMQIRDGYYTDIIGIHDHDNDWLLFCDVTAQTLQTQQYQQTSNDLVLIKDRLNRTLNRYVGQEVSNRVANGNLRFDTAGERRQISTLFVDIRGFTPFNESNDAQIVMQTLNTYMNCMLEPILAEAGLVDKIIGDGVMAVFGVLPSEQYFAHHALTAAKKIQALVFALNLQRNQAGLDALGVGIGIATGEAVLGILGSHERRAFTAIGRHVNLAARLESNASQGEILVDSETYKVLGTHESFIPRSINLKGIGDTPVFSLTATSTQI